MKVDVKKLEALRARMAEVEKEKARLEERRNQALKAVEEAKKNLLALGFRPDTAAEKLDILYQSLVQEIEQMEAAVGLTSSSR